MNPIVKYSKVSTHIQKLLLEEHPKSANLNLKEITKNINDEYQVMNLKESELKSLILRLVKQSYMRCLCIFPSINDEGEIAVNCVYTERWFMEMQRAA